MFLEAKAHNDWDEDKQKDWLENLRKRSEIDQKIFSRANFIKAKVFKDYLCEACALTPMHMLIVKRIPKNLRS